MAGSMKQGPVEFGCAGCGARRRMELDAAICECGTPLYRIEAPARCGGCGARHGGLVPMVCAACGSAFRDAAEASRDAGLDAVIEAQGLGRAARKSHLATGQGPFYCPFDLGSAEAEAWEAGYRNNLDRWLAVWAEVRRGVAA
jgi:hypothetical protein